MTEDRISPFYCGTQHLDWRCWNCDRCRKRGDYTDATQSEFVWKCDIEKALDEAVIGDGTVSPEIAKRMAYTDADNWRCGELDAEEDDAAWAKRLAPPPTRLMPLRKRREHALSFARSLVTPKDKWDEGDPYSCIDASLAWKVAWGLWHDARERVKE